jgi:argininosuccinate lyase
MKSTPRNLTTARSTDRIMLQINKELDRLRVAKDKRELIVDASRNRCAFRFSIEQQVDGKTYSVVVAKMSEAQNRIQDNMAALHLWIRNRVISLERKIETLEEAFGAHIDVKMSNLPPGFGSHLLAVTCNPRLEGPKA